MRDELTELAKTKIGTEPIYKITIDDIVYATKVITLPAAVEKANILSIESINYRTDSINSAHSTAISFTLTDSENQDEFLSKLASDDWYELPVIVEMTFDTTGEGVEDTGSIELLKGRLDSKPIWSETGQKIQLSISEIQYNESMGYQPDNKDYINANSDYNPGGWPLCYGSVKRIKAVKVTNILQGVTEKDLNSSDPTIVVPVTNGADFGTGSKNLYLADAKFTGTFNNDNLTMSSTLLPNYPTVQWGPRDPDQIYGETSHSRYFAWITQAQFDAGMRLRGMWMIRTSTEDEYELVNYCTKQEGLRCIFAYGWEKDLDETDTDATEAGKVAQLAWGFRKTIIFTLGKFYFMNLKVNSDWTLPVGASVTLQSENANVYYIANITPGSNVREVMAYRTIDGEKILSHVPSSYFEVVSAYNPSGKMKPTAGSPTSVTAIKMYNDLTYYIGEEWEDDIYVSLTSSDTGNAAKIVKIIVEEHYRQVAVGDKPIQYTLHANNEDVEDSLEDFKVGFVIREKREVMTVCRELAYQCGCALRITGTEIELVNLIIDQSGEVHPILEGGELVNFDKTLTDDHIELDSISIGQTDYYDIDTVMVSEYKKDHSQETKVTTLKENVDKFGEIDIAESYWAYWNVKLIKEVMAYWLGRMSRSWRTITFNCFLDQMDLQVFDVVKLDLSDNILNLPEIGFPAVAEFAFGRITEIVLDTVANRLTVTVLLSIEAGTDAFSDKSYVENVIEGEVNPENRFLGDSTDLLAGTSLHDYRVAVTSEPRSSRRGTGIKKRPSGSALQTTDQEILEDPDNPSEFIKDGSGANLYHAVVISVPETGDTFRIKIADDLGAYGSEQDCKATLPLDVANIIDCHPLLKPDDDIMVSFRVDDGWYLVTPTLIDGTEVGSGGGDGGGNVVWAEVITELNYADPAVDPPTAENSSYTLRLATDLLAGWATVTYENNYILGVVVKGSDNASYRCIKTIDPDPLIVLPPTETQYAGGVEADPATGSVGGIFWVLQNDIVINESLAGDPLIDCIPWFPESTYIPLVQDPVTPGTFFILSALIHVGSEGSLKWHADENRAMAVFR